MEPVVQLVVAVGLGKVTATPVAPAAVVALMVAGQVMFRVEAVEFTTTLKQQLVVAPQPLVAE
jgi:hypothetical protein